jgi:transposase
MPWKECHVEDERLRFVARLMEGQAMSTLCAEFGISRKTGYKIYERYKHWGLRGLTDRSRRPSCDAWASACGVRRSARSTRRWIASA